MSENLSDRQAAFTRAFCEFAYRNNPLVLENVLYRMRLSYYAESQKENARIDGRPYSTRLPLLAADLIVDRSRDNGRTWQVADGDDPVWYLLHERWEMDYEGAPIVRGNAEHFFFEHGGAG